MGHQAFLMSGRPEQILICEWASCELPFPSCNVTHGLQSTGCVFVENKQSCITSRFPKSIEKDSQNHYNTLVDTLHTKTLVNTLHSYIVLLRIKISLAKFFKRYLVWEMWNFSSSISYTRKCSASLNEATRVCHCPSNRLYLLRDSTKNILHVIPNLWKNVFS